MIKFLKAGIATVVVACAGTAIAAPTLFNFTSMNPTGVTGCGFSSGNDRCGPALTFAMGSLSATATASYTGTASSKPLTSPLVIQDYNGTNPKYVGLGVYHEKLTSDDNVTANELLTLTFNQVVTLSGLNFRAEGHGVYNHAGNTFLFNGGSKTLAGTISGLSVTGKTFTFGYGGAHPDQYYLAGMTVTAVPEPETYALMLAGLGLMGTMVRRRNAKNA